MSIHHGANAGFLDVRHVVTAWVTGWCIACGLASAPAESFGQSAPVVVEGGRPNREQMRAQMEAAKAAAAANPGQPTPGEAASAAGPKPDEVKKPEGEGEKKDEAANTVKRPDVPPKPPDPKDLDVALDKEGRVPPFNFIGQPWPDVMQWLANLSKSSLDWQELPNGYLNLTTQRSYPLDEVHDLINQALSARGFTSIQSGEVLSVYKIDKLDPSAVRQIDEGELLDRKPYDFVKVAFDLPPEMEIDKAKDDVKQLLSPNAKVFPLVTQRRLFIMDSVANLRTVSELLNQERMIKDGRIVPEEFVLKHSRPEHVIEVLKTMVGADANSRQPPMTPEQMQQQQQMMQQMQQQGKDPSKLMKPQQSGPPVYLAMNRRRNSVIVNAPPEQLKIIKQTIEYLDVPIVDDAQDVLANGQRTLFKYQLVTMDPEQLKTTLEEIGELDPHTELRADTKSKILFAKATPADHKKIMALKDELDGTGRTLRIFWLPRNMPAADAVAGTIMALMGGQEQEEENNDNGYWGYYSYRSRNNYNDKPKKGFRVEADIENNRVLAWANDAENKQIEQFLAELGKSSPGSESRNTVRALDVGDPAATTRLLEQLRKTWPELIIDDQRPKTETPPAEEKKPGVKPAAETKDRAAANAPSASRRDAATVGESLRDSHETNPPFHLVQLAIDSPPADSLDAEAARADKAITEAPTNVQPEVEAEPSAAAPTNRPPVTVTVTPDGRVILQSKDTAALDRLEEFIGEAAPPMQRYKIFRIQHADDWLVYQNLKEFYEDELKGDTKQVWNWWYDEYEDQKSDKGSLLSKRPPLRLVWDPDSKSILVANASARQLAEIESLIKEYDQPRPDDETAERLTRPIKIKYSRASSIVTSVKEVFRDLLSSKDKEFDSKDPNAKSGSGGSGLTILRYGPSGGSGSSSSKQTPVKVGFQGALSLGADDVSNIVLVSAQPQVFALVEDMIRELDEEAAPKTTLQVHRINGNIKAEALQKALDQAVGNAWLGNRPEPTGQNAQAEQKSEGDQNRDRDRDRGNRGDRGRGRDND